MMSEPIYLRTTERTSFRKCRRMWNYNSKMRRGLEPVKMNHNLAFGIAIHVGLENYYDPESWHFPQEVKRSKAIATFVAENNKQRKLEAKTLGELSVEREQEYKEREQLGIGMLNNYANWAVHQDRFKPIAVEELIRVPIMDGDEQLVVNGRPVFYQVRVDLLLEEEDTGEWWILDHKTAGRFDNLTFLEVDTQTISYVWAAQRHYGRRIAGLVYNELKKTAPEPPRVLKSGALSQDKSQSTTYELYEQAIREYGLDPDPYSAMLEHLRTQENPYFRRTQIHRSPFELATQEELILMEARDMLEEPRIYPNPSKMHCNYCDFRTPCAVESEKGDVDFVLGDSKLFRPRTDEGDIDEQD